MDLKDFVKKALIDITGAIEEAKASSHLAIAPGYVQQNPVTEPQFIEFDVATTVVEASNTSGSGGAKISVVGVGISLGGERGVSANHENVSRVKFQVPVYFQAKNIDKK